jgi:thiol-disulfide isomerase/thioredoxin
MPYFEKVKEKYKNAGIKFVSISTNSFKKDWSNFLDVNKLKGMQLYAGDDETFKTLFKADQVPQALLINPDGIISTALAPRPSETELIELLFDRIVEYNKKTK